ncbi:MAG: TIGR04211 family SH3 domain-containing protein, partial [Candidatus Electrothrix sp. EH2]|nr:TIGR04211 family SH3 domain-containing protein [Candidatus Electrothrix sp. EH2]
VWVGGDDFFPSLMTLFAGAATAAEIKFVRPNLDIPVRRGRGEQYKILKFVRNGDQVEFFEEKHNWAKVRLQNGTEGWMLNRYLSDEKPPTEQLRELQEENEQLKSENEKLQSELTRSNELQEASSQELERLQTTANEKLALSISECNKIKDQYKASQEFNKIIWFLSGAGVLLVGWLLGRFASGSQKRRNRLF